jgi:hypothetical protein
MFARAFFRRSSDGDKQVLLKNMELRIFNLSRLNARALEEKQVLLKPAAASDLVQSEILG